MRTVLQIIEEAGGLATFTWTRIENPPFMLLVIESLGEPGPSGHRALSIAHYGEQNGDGMRAVVYFQGCNLGCAGCWNPATHAFAGPPRGVQYVAEQVEVAHQTRVLDGVTVSGGEPMQQALDLLDLIRVLKRAKPELSIG